MIHSSPISTPIHRAQRPRKGLILWYNRICIRRRDVIGVWYWNLIWSCVWGNVKRGIMCGHEGIKVEWLGVRFCVVVVNRWSWWSSGGNFCRRWCARVFSLSGQIYRDVVPPKARLYGIIDNKEGVRLTKEICWRVPSSNLYPDHCKLHTPPSQPPKH